MTSEQIIHVFSNMRELTYLKNYHHCFNIASDTYARFMYDILTCANLQLRTHAEKCDLINKGVTTDVYFLLVVWVRYE